jgi:CheY-like chemotaxis protein
VLDRVSALLADAFDVVAVATSGSQAVETVNEVSPDVIVLDINMPGLDGFQTRDALEQAGSRAPVVFLSIATSDDVIVESFRRGGRGYVVKSHMGRDLPSTLEHVLSGRLFVPSLTALVELADVTKHAMQLHGDLESFLDGLAAFFGLALRRGDATCVIATEDVREGLGRRLQAAGWDVGGPSRHKRHLVIDAADAMNRCSRNGVPDTSIMAEMVFELDQYRRDVGEGPSPRLTMFGNVAEEFLANGNPSAAFTLESEWNVLTRDLPFFALCGYSTARFDDGAPEVWSRACQVHYAVSHARGL